MNTYKRHRFHPSIISYAVWIYYRFNMSFRDIEDLLAEKGISVSYEAARFRDRRMQQFLTYSILEGI